MDNYANEMRIKCREAYDALNSGMLDTTDLDPYLDTIKEALQVAGVKWERIEQEHMIGQMQMATAVKVRLDIGLTDDARNYVESFLREYKEWFREKRSGVKSDGRI